MSVLGGKRTFTDLERKGNGARERIRRMTANVEALSEREKAMLRLLLVGHDAKSFARSLELSVHTVNERLRASRRKLGVSSSREAARILAQSERRSPDLLVHKEIGVFGEVVDLNNDHIRIEQKGLRHPIVLAIGGTLIMSLIAAAAVLSWVASGVTEPGPLPNWSTATAAPERIPEQLNTLRLDGNSLLWNGRNTSEATIREFLRIVNGISPNHWWS